MSKTVLIVAAHTDDEALGCGGTIARHVADGDTVYAVFMADGVSSRAQADHDDLANRNAAAEHAREILGIRENFYLGLPDNRLDSLPLIEVIQRLEPIISKVQPSIIYTHHCADLNIDHRITHQAVMTACRPIPGDSVREIYAFEVASSTEWSSLVNQQFIPNVFVDITDYWHLKQHALDAYAIEMRPAPHSRSIDNIMAMALHRGHSVGKNKAEAFMLIRALR